MPVITVSQLNNYMKRFVDGNIHLTGLWIKGEISNCKQHYSGHIYLTLKDSLSVLKVIMFRSYCEKLKFRPENGMCVMIFGNVSVFERDGIYQLYAEKIIPDGVGELYAAYRQLKARLDEEGLFRESVKKKIPVYPKRIAVVTSPTGAALRDIINIITRRYPLCHIRIYPVKVQGIGAADSICDALKRISENKDCDTVILGRGGGSLEDLWAFNEEKTAYAIYNCSIPVISAVGHETDYTISDFVADLRAPTPSAAAELAVPDAGELWYKLDNYVSSMTSSVVSAYRHAELSLKVMDDEFLLSSEMSILLNKQLMFQNVLQQINNSCNYFIAGISGRVSSLNSELNALNPDNVLKRGYSYVTSPDGHVLDFDDLKIGDSVNVTFDKGILECKILNLKKTKRRNNFGK